MIENENNEITKDTQVLLPIDKFNSKLIENDKEYILPMNTFEILEKNCEYFGSSFEGRKAGTKSLIGITHKAPIIVEESQKLIFFPTKSHENQDCIWINLAQVDKYYKTSQGGSAIKFKSGDLLELNISIGIITNQILRASRLKYKLEERLQKKEIY